MARPAEFDRNDVLDKAMAVFWRTGYSATSVTDLVRATNLKPGSLYGAFNSKRGLFMEVIDTYAERSLARINDCIAEAESPLEAVHRFVWRIATEVGKDEIGKGCLMVNTLLELATEDEEIRIVVTSYLAKIEERLRQTICLAQENGELCDDADSAALTKLLMTGIWGLRVMSTTRPDPAIYPSIVTHMLSALPQTSQKTYTLSH